MANRSAPESTASLKDADTEEGRESQVQYVNQARSQACSETKGSDTDGIYEGEGRAVFA